MDVERALDFDQTYVCAGCGADVRIRVAACCNAFHVVWVWQNKLGGKCKECLEKEKGGEPC